MPRVAIQRCRMNRAALETAPEERRRPRAHRPAPSIHRGYSPARNSAGAHRQSKHRLASDRQLRWNCSTPPSLGHRALARTMPSIRTAIRIANRVTELDTATRTTVRITCSTGTTYRREVSTFPNDPSSDAAFQREKRPGIGAWHADCNLHENEKSFCVPKTSSIRKSRDIA